MIKITNVSKHYGDFKVLTDCTTSVSKGEVIVVCGPSGSCLLYTSPSPRD